MAESLTDIPTTVRKEDLCRCEKVLDNLISASEKYGVKEAQQTLDGWRSKLKDLQLKLENPSKIKIALFGDTGQGKSSLLNALFDQPDLLPTDGYGSSCTSVITKIEIVDRRPDDLDKEGFQAEITFISTEEWNQEIEVLRNEMVEDAEGDEDEVRKRAVAKLTAVYGSIEHLETAIAERNDVSEKLEAGTQTTDIFDNASDLQEEIEDYIIETDNEKQFWPIVRHVLIRLFHPQISGQGIVFVDLPGVADTNPVRVKIAEDEKQSAKVLLVLSRIDRCLSNPTLKSIVGDQRSCEMEMDQQENIIVCTRTDDVPEVKRAKKHMTEEEWNEVKELELSIKESKKTIAELEKQKGGDHDADLLSQLDRLKSECKKMEESRVIKCGNFRNNSVKKNLSKSTQSKVFCVSSTDYMKIAKNHDGDGKPTVFKEKEDTEIPQLRAFLQNIAFQQKEKEFELIQQQFSSVLSDTHVYLLNFQIGGKEQSQEEVASKLEEMRESLKDVRSLLCLAITNMFKDQLFPLVNDGLLDAVNSAVQTSSKWGLSSGKKLSQTNNTGLLVNTYKATVARNGYFRRRNGPIDFNMDLAYPLIKKIVKPWMEVFREEKWEQLIESEVKSPSTEIIEKYSRQIQHILIQERSDEEVGRNLQVIKEDALKKLEHLTVFEEKIEQPQRQAHRVITHTIQEKMKPTYKECAEQKNKGCFDRMKGIMKSQVEEKKEDIFQCTERNLKQTLLDVKTGACNYVRDYLMDIYDDYKQQMDPLWLNQVEQKYRQEIEGAKKDLLAVLHKDNDQGHQGENRKRPENMTTDERKVPEKKPKKVPLTGNGRRGRGKNPRISQTQVPGPSQDSAVGPSTQTIGGQIDDGQQQLQGLSQQGDRSDATFPLTGNGRRGRGKKPRISQTQIPGPSGDSAVGPSTQTIGGQIDDGQQQLQGLSQQGDRSDATHYGKVNTDKEPVSDMRLLLKTSQSIGLIGASGTGFKVGRNFIMTASHVFAAAFGWQDREFATDSDYQEIVNTRLEEDPLFIDFYVEDRSIEHMFRLRFVGYVNRHLDVAVAELDRDASHIPSFSHFIDTNNRRVKFHFLGHDNADIHQYRDPNCETVTKAKAQQYKTAIMNLPGSLSVTEDYLSRYDIMGCSSEYLHFQCGFKQGGSGSPGLMVTGGKVKVLTMLIAGYPNDNYISSTRPDLCVEEGIRMKAIKDDMKKNNVMLCKDIFKRYADHDTLWYM